VQLVRITIECTKATPDSQANNAHGIPGNLACQVSAVGCRFIAGEMRDAAGGLMTCMKQLAMVHLLEQAARLATAGRIRSFVSAPWLSSW
jgi:hypothetical protein